MHRPNKIIQTWNKLTLRGKFYTLSSAFLAVAMAAVLIRGTSISSREKEAYLRDVATKLSKTTAASVSSRVDRLQNKLLLVASTKDAPTQLKILLSQSRDFVAVAQVSVDSQGRISIPWSYLVDKAYDEKALVNKLNFNSFVELQNFELIPDKNVLAFAMRVEVEAPAVKSASKTWMIGFLPESVFDDVLNVFSTGVNHAYVVDQNNRVLSTSESAVEARTLDFSRSLASLSPIGGTNLTLVVTTSSTQVFSQTSFVRGVLIVLLALLILSFALVTLLTDFYFTEPLKKLKAMVSEGRYKSPLRDDIPQEILDVAYGLSQIETRAEEERAAFIEEQSAVMKAEKLKVYELLCGTIAREIKNPLSGVLGHLQLAQTKNPTPEVAHYLSLSEKEIRRCRSIVENLGRLSGTEKMIFENVSLVDVVKNALELTEVALSQAQVKVIKDFKPCSAVAADSTHLQHVVAALLRNAAQALEEAPRRLVTLRIFEVEGRARLQVEDSGFGIPSEAQAHIFEPFFTTKPKGRGAGLSLASSYGIVREHKGTLSFQSERGRTVFTIDLPAKNYVAKPQTFHPDFGLATDVTPN